MKEGMGEGTPIEDGWSKETGIRGGSVDGKHTRAMGTPVVRSTIGTQWMDLRYC